MALLPLFDDQGLLFCALTALLSGMIVIFILVLTSTLALLIYHTEKSAFLFAFVAAFALVGSVATTACLLVLLICGLRENYFQQPKRKRIKRGHPTTEGEYVPLNRFHFSFYQLANLDTLIPLLSQEGVLSAAELSDFISLPSRGERLSYLVTVVDRKGTRGLQGLIRALKQDDEHLGHAELAAAIEVEYSHMQMC